MKKKSILCSILLLCMMLLGTMGFAQTTYTFSEYPEGVQYAVDEEHVLDEDVTLYTTNCYFTTELRVYANTGFFYSNALPYYIDSLAFNMKGNNSSSVASIYGSTDGDDWVLLGTIPTTSSYANLGISFGDNDYQYFKFALTSGNPQIRIKNMTIYYKPYGPSGTATQAPTFSPSSGIYTNPISVTLASSTENASIYYTLDGTTPTTASTLYTSPITISQTTTVKAMATADGYNNSSVSSATYTFPYSVNNISAYKALQDSTEALISNDVTFVFNHNQYTYVKDATAGLLLYGYNNVGSNFSEGDQIANLMGTKTTYNDQIEMSVSYFESSSAASTGPVTPIIATISDITSNYAFYDAQLVTIENVTFPDGFTGLQQTTFTQGSESMTLFNKFSLDTTIAAGTTLNLTGFVAIYNDTIQIYPRYNQDLDGQGVVPTPFLSITAPANGSTFSTLDTLPIGLNYQNFVLGTDGYIKVESPLLTLVGLDNPLYMTEELYNMMSMVTFTPLPAGTHTITCSLVDMDYVALNPAVSATTTFTVVAPELEEPVILVEGLAGEEFGTYYFNATISITAENGASIYYTTNGTEPTEASTLYTGPFQITTTTTIKAIAVKANYQNSNVASEYVIITAPTVATPEFLLTPGTYGEAQTVGLYCETEEADIHYTLDGTEPTESSELYIIPFTLDTTSTVKAKAFKTDWFPSETATAVYTISYEPIMTVDADALNFSSTQLSQEFTVSGAHLDEAITLTCNNTHFTVTPATITTPNSNTVVTVTFDGSEPATGIIAIVSDTLSAQVSLTATAQLPAPVLTPATEVSDSAITVTISCAVADANIHYTTDGTEPTTASAAYTQAIVFNTPGTYTVKALAVKANWENSDVTTGTYTINEPPTPQPLDTIIYSVGFEASEGFVATDVYNNTDIAYTGTNGRQWGTYYGTPSTTSPIKGSQSMHMRWYSASANNLGYTFTNFDLRNVTHVTFLAKNSNGLKVKVSHSVDGGNTYSDGEIFTLGSTAQGFDYVVDEDGSYDFVRLKFSIVLPETAPTSTSRLYLDSVVVYGIPGIAPSMASIPSINPNSGFFYEPQTVSITCETEDAVIRYTTDGSEPTEASTIYTEPFQVSATTTIKAKAWKTDLAPSFTATAEISFPAQVLDIAAFKDAASNEPQQIMSDVTFVFRSGRYIFVEDNSAAMLIFDNSPATITSTYNEGDVIHSGVFGRYSLYHGMVEMVPSHNAAAATGTPVTVTPTVATVANVKSQYNDIYESKLVRLNDVEFINDTLFVQNGDTMSIRDRFNTVDLEISAGDHADVIGFVCYSYSHGYQIYPRNNQDIIISAMETVATPEFFFQRDGEFYRMTITCETEGASIYYTIDGNDPDESSYEYTDAVPFYLNVHYIINAIAMKEGMNNSAIATYDYNPVGISQFELRDNLVVYPNPAVSNVVISAKDGDLSIERVELYNIYGQLLNTTTVNGSRAEISVSSLATGTYFAKVFTDKGITTMPIIRK